MSIEEDYQKTLTRWADTWTLSIKYSKRPIGWIGSWRGPLDGHYRIYALTRWGVERRTKRELARWTRKRRKIAKLRKRTFIKTYKPNLRFTNEDSSNK